MDCMEGLKLLEDNSVDSIVTDPPYFLTNNSTIDIKSLLKNKKIKLNGFMNKDWDGGIVEILESDIVPKELL